VDGQQIAASEVDKGGVKLVCILVVAGAICTTTSIGVTQAQRDGEPASGIPPEYLGDWICQSVVPGYDVRPPHADSSQPLTNRLTTTPSVQILKFSLMTDGTYESADAKGRFAFDSAANAITWLDGSYASTMSKAELGRRDSGAPKMGLLLDKRYYGCFKPKPRAPGD
jgi:hypothetical protein